MTTDPPSHFHERHFGHQKLLLHFCSRDLGTWPFEIKRVDMECQVEWENDWGCQKLCQRFDVTRKYRAPNLPSNTGGAQCSAMFVDQEVVACVLVMQADFEERLLQRLSSYIADVICCSTVGQSPTYNLKLCQIWTLYSDVCEISFFSNIYKLLFKTSKIYAEKGWPRDHCVVSGKTCIWSLRQLHAWVSAIITQQIHSSQLFFHGKTERRSWSAKVVQMFLERFCTWCSIQDSVMSLTVKQSKACQWKW